MVCVILSGCGRLRIEPIDHLRGAGLDESFPDASMAQFDLPFKKLDLAITLAFKRQNWGSLRLMKPSPTFADTSGTSHQVLRAAALLPDGRTVQVVGWPVDGSKFTVAVRIGHFGDRDQERAFLELLHKTLRGAKLTRRRHFKLPDLPRKD